MKQKAFALRDGNLTYAILGLVAARRAEGIHGYALKRDLDAVFGDMFRVDHGRLYRILDALEQAGDVTRQIQPQSKRPNRKVYRVAEKGLCTLERWLQEPIAPMPGPLPDEVSLKLLLLDTKQIDRIAGLIRERRTSCLARLNGIAKTQRVLRSAGVDDRISKLIVDGAETRVRAELAWLERIERTVVKEF